jgi:D-glycero-D-manno-heptose 1,7-bisphosphate phosphatase
MPFDQALEIDQQALLLMRILCTAGSSRTRGSAIFIDRDGVINCRRAGDYVLDWSQFIFMPEIRGALRELSCLQLPMIVISNQSAVGRGLLTPAALQDITARMHKILVDDGVSLTAGYFCTHTPDEGCSCRKPKPGLLYAAAADFNIDLSRSIFIGDSNTDIQAARAAGCQPVLFGPGLNPSSDEMDWVAGIPVALTGRELFGVVVDWLRLADEGKPCHHAVRGAVWNP